LERLSPTYVYDGSQFLEGRPSGGTTKRYVYGPGIDRPLGQSVGGVTSYFAADHLGSVVTTTAASGAPTLTREYALGGTNFKDPDAKGCCGDKYHRVELYISRNVMVPWIGFTGLEDYHWLRQDGNGMWSSKHGVTPVGPQVSDPDEDARLWNYTLAFRKVRACIESAGLRFDGVVGDHEK